MVLNLEQYIDKFELELPPLTNFILPGGDPSAAQLHYVRTVVRRAESQTVLLSEKDEINSNCIKYLNRLSDLFFVMGRLINKRKKHRRYSLGRSEKTNFNSSTLFIFFKCRGSSAWKSTRLKTGLSLVSNHALGTISFK